MERHSWLCVLWRWVVKGVLMRLGGGGVGSLSTWNTSSDLRQKVYSLQGFQNWYSVLYRVLYSTTDNTWPPIHKTVHWGGSEEGRRELVGRVTHSANGCALSSLCDAVIDIWVRWNGYIKIEIELILLCWGCWTFYFHDLGRLFVHLRCAGPWCNRSSCYIPVRVFFCVARHLDTS